MTTKLSINALNEATALDRRTIKRRLSEAGLLDGRDSWALPEVLPILFAGPEPAQFAKNRDLLVVAQTKRIQIENDTSERKLIPAALVVKAGDRNRGRGNR
jgi:hypothetical protein